MPRALFEKTGNAIFISHLDLMRLFQRAFQRSGLPLTHTQGFNPRPSVSIALPLSLGVESGCELLDFDLAGDKISNEEICARLNGALIAGVRVLRVYDSGQKIKNLSLLESVVTLEYDSGIPENARQQIAALFARERLVVEKKGKNSITEQDLIPMLRRISVGQAGEKELALNVLACCQNPTLNPMQLSAAIGKYLPDLTPDFVRCRRVEIYDANEEVFR
ncbi:MAG: TIGR03936 family radical SAM-associated protein [Faecousia sp.]